VPVHIVSQEIPDSIVVAGAGIGGLNAALSLARKGFAVSIHEQAKELLETGAGIQLSPNVTRILIELGLEDRLRQVVVAPDYLSVRNARTGGEITRMALGRDIAQRYGAPYWSIHRCDLQNVLHEAVLGEANIALHLGSRMEGVDTHERGVTVHLREQDRTRHVDGTALIGSDGVWSVTRRLLEDPEQPRFSGRIAFRATVPAEAVPEIYRKPAVTLWLGHGTHLVHYPVRAGALINIVAITRGGWQGESWSAPADQAELLSYFTASSWGEAPRAILRTPSKWLKWALVGHAPLQRWGYDRITLLGDAAHPMLPFLAQGAAMAIEDGAVLADCFARNPGDIPAALRDYENLRRERATRVQQSARFTGDMYELPGPAAFARNLLLGGMGGDRLRMRHDWLYGWKQPTA